MAIKESPSASIAAEESQIAKAVLMPGDPLRAKYVADHYLEEVVCFNTVRNMLGYTGTYKGKRISVMGHGMGVPSMGIYSYELYQFFGVDTIIRIGSAGGIGDDVKVRDVVIALGPLPTPTSPTSTGSPASCAPPPTSGSSGTRWRRRRPWASGQMWVRCSRRTSSTTTTPTPGPCTGSSASWRWRWRRLASTGRPSGWGSGRCPC